MVCVVVARSYSVWRNLRTINSQHNLLDKILFFSRRLRSVDVFCLDERSGKVSYIFVTLLFCLYDQPILLLFFFTNCSATAYFCYCMQFMVSLDCEETLAATSEFEIKIDQNNISDFIFQSFQINKKPCHSLDFCNACFCNDNTSPSLVVHLNISSLHAHFDELIEFLDCFLNLPSILLLSKTRIKTKPFVNVNISCYSFVHSPSTTNADGIGMHFSKKLKIYSKLYSY